MSYGFNAISDSGQILLSSDYYSYNLLSGVVNDGPASSSATGAYNNYHVYYPSSNPPLIFIDMDVGDTAAVWGLNQVGNNWYFSISGSMRADTTKVKPFGKITSSTGTNYGLLVRNSAGQDNFSSNSNPLWVTDYNSITSQTLSSPNFDQITGSLAYANTNPIFLCNLVYALYNPIAGALTVIGWKRTATSTYSTYAIYSGISSTTVRYQGMVVGDLVV